MSDSNKNIDEKISAFYQNYKKNGIPVSETSLKIIDIIGRENILKIYDLIGAGKISFFPLKNYVEAEKIIKDFTTTNKPLKEISDEINCSSKKAHYVLKKFRVISNK